MRRAINRFFDWIFHPSVRREPIARGKAVPYRYPTPGSNIPEDEPLDYRRAFTTTPYNVRYSELTEAQTKEWRSYFKSTSGIEPSRVLVLLGLLKEADIGNEAAIAEAKKKHKQLYGFEVGGSVYRDDFETIVPDKNNREGIREAIVKNFQAASLDYELNSNYGDFESRENPNIMEFESLDLFDAPHFQQQRIDSLYRLDEIANLRADTGIDVRKGQASFWKALDDSNDPENIQKVQRKVGDENPLSFELKEGKLKLEFDKEGNVVDIHRQQ